MGAACGSRRACPDRARRSRWRSRPEPPGESMSEAKKILWADDEIDLLRPHVLYLEARGYDVSTVANGRDAGTLAGRERFDCVLLDEMMPGMDGVATLSALRELDPTLPVIMVTKSEEEDLME